MTGGLVESIGRENMGTEPAAKVQKTVHTAEVPLLVKKLSEHATLPKRGSANAAGYDLARCLSKLPDARPITLIRDYDGCRLRWGLIRLN